jgi:uncharacterized protein YbaP (TraB family)
MKMLISLRADPAIAKIGKLKVQKQHIMKKLTTSCLLILFAFFSDAQKTHSSYPSLLWEITGNGMTKPSYLFGTMHVSSKMVFHLSDSFYHAISVCDMVSLEVDPRQWEPEMFRLMRAGAELTSYYEHNPREFMTENSFRLTKYEDKLKIALKEEPMQVNGLLYRTYQQQADFEENTYLDLYIYQTARKLGKKATGVENYLESERLMAEATEDAAREKRVRKTYPEGENIYTIQNKIQDAYRQGDLSLLDSLSKFTSTSDAFDEKFLYRRNEIQARSIDSIIQKQTLFVAVGAAHLPGARGVIELLRKKGYLLRPVLMADQDALQREKLDKMNIPIEMKEVSSPDGFIHCVLPGSWFKRDESFLNESWQYADMENGSYYMFTRIRTNGGIGGLDPAVTMKTVDSLLYDNIPGKILRKTKILRNGYEGFEIVNKNRHGDMQRYTILITPFEVLIFKMSGNEEYVSGKEADQFFDSIHLKEAAGNWDVYTPSTGGFRVAFPQAPLVHYGKEYNGRENTWEYEANSPGGEAYMVLRKSINNYRFLEEDTVDLSLMEESLRGSYLVGKELARKFGQLDGHDCLDLLFALKGGGYLKAKAVIKGPDYYLLLARAKDNKTDLSKFFGSSHLTAYTYGPSVLYTDTVLHFSVRTPRTPVIDKDLEFLVHGMTHPAFSQAAGERYVYETTTKYAYFKNDSTGEGVAVTIATLPKFFYRTDSLKFWENEMQWAKLKEEFILQEKEYFQKGDSVSGYRYTLLDTNSNRKIKGLAEVKGNTCYKVTALTDKLSGESSFIKDFFDSFEGTVALDGSSVFRNKTTAYFKEYHSKDSLTKKLAHEALSHFIFEGKDLAKIQHTILHLNPSGKSYEEAKARLILALGRIRDTCCSYRDSMLACLRGIYQVSSDTPVIQNAVLLSLARMKTKESYAFLKECLLQKPPVFDNTGELNELFRFMGEDTLLGRSMLPGILQLAAIEDFKTPVRNFLFALADSGVLKKEDCSDYYASLLFDAQVLVKKQQSMDTRSEVDKVNGEPYGELMDRMGANPPGESDYTYANTRPSRSKLLDYATILMPFYDRPAVQKVFEQIFRGKDPLVKLSAAVLLIKNDKPVPDSILLSMAAEDKYRAPLFRQLEKIGKTSFFPAKYKNQPAMSRSLLVESRPYEKVDTIVAAGKKSIVLKNTKGTVYFFKYKLKDHDEWLMGIGGVQPTDQAAVNTERKLVSLTGKKFKSDEPEQQQFEDKLHQMVLSERSSAQFFFTERDNLLSSMRLR